MRRLIYVAASAIGFSALLLAQKLMRKNRNNQPSANKVDVQERNTGSRAGRSKSGLSQMAVKKDGSLDMRHRENKEAVRSETVNTAAVHLKKNGEPDRRYRENRDL